MKIGDPFPFHICYEDGDTETIKLEELKVCMLCLHVVREEAYAGGKRRWKGATWGFDGADLHLPGCIMEKHRR